MATSDQPTLSDSQIAKLEKEKQWAALKRYGRTKSRALGLTEDDVPRLIAESRQERGR